jgi:hypothetical protein
LSQEHAVGVKWKTKRGWRDSQHLGMFVGGVVVQDYVHYPPDRHGGLDGVQEANELLVPMALQAVA